MIQVMSTNRSQKQVGKLHGFFSKSWRLLVLPMPDFSDLDLKKAIARSMVARFSRDNTQDRHITRKEIDERLKRFLNDEQKYGG